MVATTQAEREVVIRNVILLPPALFASLRLHDPVLGHRFATMTLCPVGLLLAEEAWIRFLANRTDVFPLGAVIKTKTVLAHSVFALLPCKIAMSHSNLLLATRF